MQSPPFSGGSADDAWLKIRQPEVIGPAVSADRGRVAAVIVGAVDQDAANALFVHLGEGDLGRAGRGGHAPIIPLIRPEAKPLERLVDQQGHEGTGEAHH
jgi:hypothetical protein